LWDRASAPAAAAAAGEGSLLSPLDVAAHSLRPHRPQLPPRLRLRGSGSMRGRRILGGLLSHAPGGWIGKRGPGANPREPQSPGRQPKGAAIARAPTQGSRNRLGERPAATSSGLSRGRSPSRLRRLSKTSSGLTKTAALEDIQRPYQNGGSRRHPAALPKRRLSKTSSGLTKAAEQSR
jgi:hypothetical protein